MQKNTNKQNYQELSTNIVILVISNIVGGFITLVLTALLGGVFHLTNSLQVAFYIWTGISIIILAILRVLFRSKLIRENKFNSWW